MPLYQLVLLFVFFIGFAAISAVPGLEGAEIDLALLRVTGQTYGPWVLGLVGAAGLLTALVPGSLIMMTTATILSRLITSLHPASAEREVQIARLAVPLVAAVSLIFVFSRDQTLVTLLLFAYAIVTQLFPSIMLSLCCPQRANAVAALAGIVVGVGTVVWTTFTRVSLSSLLPSMPSAVTDMNIGVLALLANVLVLGVLTTLLPRQTTN